MWLNNNNSLLARCSNIHHTDVITAYAVVIIWLLKVIIMLIHCMSFFLDKNWTTTRLFSRQHIQTKMLEIHLKSLQISRSQHYSEVKHFIFLNLISTNRYIFTVKYYIFQWPTHCKCFLLTLQIIKNTVSCNLLAALVI